MLKDATRGAKCCSDSSESKGRVRLDYKKQGTSNSAPNNY